MPADHDSQSSDRSGRRADPMAEHKRRARWRLLGALITVAAVGAVAPFFLEDQARPLSQDLLIEIPSRSSLFTKIDQLKPAETASESTPIEAKRDEPAAKSSVETAPATAASSAAATSSSSPPAAPSASTPPASSPATASPAPTSKSGSATETKSDALKKPGKGLYVQVGVYSKSETAKSVQAKLTLGGHKVWVEPITREDGIERYRVRIGPFETREQANEVRDRAKTQGYEAIVVTNP